MPPLQLVGSLASRQGPAATTTLIDNEQQAQRGERLDSLKRVVVGPRVRRARSTRRCSRRRWRCPSSRWTRSLRLPTQLRQRWRFSLLPRSAPPISSCRSRLPLRPSWRSSSSRTSRRSRPTRRAAGHTSSRKRTSGPCRALSQPRAARRLHPDGCRLGHCWCLRPHFRRAVACLASGGTVVVLHLPAYRREPPRCARVRNPLRTAHVCLRRRDVRADRHGRRKMRCRRLPAGARSRSTRRRSRRSWRARSPARVLLGRGSANRCRSNLERCKCLQASARTECREDSPRHGSYRHLALRRCVLPRRPYARSSEWIRFRHLGDRTCDVPRFVLDLVSLLRRARSDVCDSRSRCEHVLPGVSATWCRPGARPVLSSPVHQSG